MNREFDNKLHKKMLSTMIVTVFVIFSLYSIVLTTLYVKAETDIAFMIPVFIDLIPYITDVSEIIGMVIAYTYILYAFYRFEKKQIISYTSAFVLLTLYKYFAKLAITYIMNGSIPAVKTLLEDMLRTFIMPLVLELAQLVIIILISHLVMKRVFAFIKEKKALEGKLDNYSFNENAVFFPFVKLWNKDNPLQKIAFWYGIVIMASKMLQLLSIDIVVGLPTSLADFLWMFAAYSLCVILGFATYLFVVWLLMKLNAKEIKLKYD